MSTDPVTTHDRLEKIERGISTMRFVTVVGGLLALFMLVDVGAYGLAGVVASIVLLTVVLGLGLEAKVIWIREDLLLRDRLGAGRE